MTEERTSRWPFTIVVVLVCVVFLYFWLPLLGRRSHPKSTVVRVQLYNIATGCTQYYSEYSSWPANIENLYSNANPRRLQLSNERTIDAWGNPIIYEPYDEKRGFGALKSLGRDGKPGGSGEDEDIEIRLDETAGILP